MNSPEQHFELQSGRQASLKRSDLDSSEGSIFSITLTEPHDEMNEWETRFSLARQGSQLAVFCQMRVGNRDSAVGNLRVDPRCPRFLREIIGKGNWFAGPTEVKSVATSYLSGPQADELVALIWNADRKLPVVVVSEFDGFTLHPDILDQLAYDLSGIAHVGLIDTDAAWRITKIKGKEWSCFWGAVRLYWPMSGREGIPKHHPFWTPGHVLTDGADTREAAARIRRSIRWRILSQSAALRPPNLISDLRDAHWKEIAKRAEQSEEHHELFELAASAEARLRDEIGQLKEDLDAATAENQDLERNNEDLNAQLRQMSLAFAHAGHPTETPSDSESLQPDDLPQPTSVSEAVEQARLTCNNLRLGSSVNEGVNGLDPSAGPPDEVLRYLQELSDMAGLIIESGEIGEHPHKWLGNRNVASSGETQLTMRNRSEQQKRTWDNGLGESETFKFHLKVNEHANPAKCVRIYYKLGAPGNPTSIGWVGRHP